MKIHLTKVTRYTTDKNGNPLKTKDGRPYERLYVQADEFQARYISGFSSDWNKDWKEGDTVEAEVEEVGEYLNLKKADPLKALEERVADLEAKINS